MKIGISQIVYYEFDSHPLSVGDVRRLWELLAILKRSAKAYVYQTTEEPSAGIELRCGDVEAYNRLFYDSSGSFWGGFDCLKSSSSSNGLVDAEFGFGCKQSSRWKGVDTLPDSSLYFSESLLNEVGWRDIASVFKNHFELADSANALSGFIDVGSADHLFSGMVFESIVLPKMPLYRWVEQARWVTTGKHKFNRLRGLYWGNYFSSKTIAALDTVCNGDFLNSYKSQARYADGESNGIIWELRNGIFVSISLSPLDCEPGKPIDLSTQNNLVWLVEKLLLADLM